MDNKQKKSIKTTIILVAITTMLLSMGGISHLVFSRWFNSAKQESGRMARKISEDIQNQIQSYMHVPMHINEVSYKYVEHDFLIFLMRISGKNFLLRCWIPMRIGYIALPIVLMKGCIMGPIGMKKVLLRLRKAMV